MADQRDSDFISQYDSFAPPVEESAAPGRAGSAGKLLVFLIQLPSWIVAGLFGVVLYSQISHQTVNLGPLQIGPSIGTGAAGGEVSSDDFQKLSQKIEDLTNKVDALASRSAAPAPAVGAPPAASSVPPVRTMPPNPGAAASKPAKVASASTAPAGGAKGKGVSGGARASISQAAARGRDLSNQILSYARSHGGSLGTERSRFVHDSDQWLNSTYNMLEERAGADTAMNFMATEPGDSDVSGVGSEDARLVRSLQARVAVLQRMSGGVSASAEDDDN